MKINDIEHELNEITWDLFGSSMEEMAEDMTGSYGRGSDGEDYWISPSAICDAMIRAFERGQLNFSP